MIATFGAAILAPQVATDAATVADAPVAADASDGRIEAITRQKTHALLRAMEQQDEHGVESLMASSVTWSNPMATTGDNDADAVVREGEEAVMTYLFDDLHALIDTVDFDIDDVTIAGQTSIVEARGDFVTTAGVPYRNVYIFHFDWRNGELVSGIEYLNPMTVCWSFQLAVCTPPPTPPY